MWHILLNSLLSCLRITQTCIRRSAEGGFSGNWIAYWWCHYVPVCILRQLYLQSSKSVKANLCWIAVTKFLVFALRSVFWLLVRPLQCRRLPFWKLFGRILASFCRCPLIDHAGLMDWASIYHLQNGLDPVLAYSTFHCEQNIDWPNIDIESILLSLAYQRGYWPSTQALHCGHVGVFWPVSHWRTWATGNHCILQGRLLRKKYWQHYPDNSGSFWRRLAYPVSQYLYRVRFDAVGGNKIYWTFADMLASTCTGSEQSQVVLITKDGLFKRVSLRPAMWLEHHAPRGMPLAWRLRLIELPLGMSNEQARWSPESREYTNYTPNTTMWNGFYKKLVCGARSTVIKTCLTILRS